MRARAKPDMSVVVVSDDRLAPPPHLTDAQAAEWRAIVDSLPADYFRPGDVPLLAAYCTAAVFYKRAAAEMDARGMSLVDDKGREFVNPVHQVLTSQASAMAQMAVKLRLCPSARYTEKSAETQSRRAGAGKRPWDERSAAA